MDMYALDLNQQEGHGDKPHDGLLYLLITRPASLKVEVNVISSPALTTIEKNPDSRLRDYTSREPTGGQENRLEIKGAVTHSQVRDVLQI